MQCPHWPSADIDLCSSNVRSWGQGRHGSRIAKCQLLTQSGHRSFSIETEFTWPSPEFEYCSFGPPDRELASGCKSNMRKGCLSARPRYHSFRHKPAVAVDRRPSSLWPAIYTVSYVDSETLCEQHVQAAPSVGLFEAANAAMRVLAAEPVAASSAIGP
jgi:hypothetical protein